MKLLTKTPIFKAIKISWITLSVISLPTAGYIIYNQFAGEEVAVAAPTTDLKGEVNISKIAFGEAVKTGKVIGYENPNFQYQYKFDSSPEFIKKQKGDNLVEQGLKGAGKALFGKEYIVDLNSRILFGYDLLTMQEEDFIFDKNTKTLTIKTPELELLFIPEFELTEFDTFIGAFRLGFTEDERKLIYQDAVNHGESIVLDSDEEIEKGYQMTDDFIRNFLMLVPDIKENVREIRFEHSTLKLKTENN